MGDINQNKKASFLRRQESHPANRGSWYTTIADEVAYFLTSKALLLLAFGGFMAYRYYEVQQIFDAVLDDTWPSHVIAVVAIFTTLIFMVNSSHLAPIPLREEGTNEITGHIHWSKLVLVIYAFVINYYFWKPWQGVDIYDIGMRWFCCVMFSSMDYGFAHLFKEKQAETFAHETLEELEEQITDRASVLASLKDELEIISEKGRVLSQQISQFTCPHCGDVFWPEKSINAHIPKCKKKLTNQLITDHQFTK